MKSMKRLVLCMLMLSVGTCAWGEVMEFRYFSLDVPEGWTVSEDGSAVTVTAEDGTGSLSLTAGSPNGKSIAELAGEYSARLGGTPPEAGEDGGYTFECEDGKSQAVIDGDEDLYLLIVGSGIEQNGEVLGEILESLEMR